MDRVALGIARALPRQAGGARHRLAAADGQWVEEVLARAEAILKVAWLHNWQLQNYGVLNPPQEEGEEGMSVDDAPDIFDRERLNIFAFSGGGQMGYRVAQHLATKGWKLKGYAAFSCSIGGWYTEGRRMRSQVIADVDWTPVLAPYQTPSNLTIASVLHVHGSEDDKVNHVEDGPSVSTGKLVRSQLDPFLGIPFDDVARADISGLNSALRYSAAIAAAVGGPGSLLSDGWFPPAVPPVVGRSFSDRWLDAFVVKRVIFALIPGLGHVVPLWGPAAAIQFFREVGGL
jgi:hypothetical protein